MSAADVKINGVNGVYDCRSPNGHVAQVHYDIGDKCCRNCASLHSDIKECVQEFGIRLENFLHRLELLVIAAQQEETYRPICTTSMSCGNNKSDSVVATVNDLQSECHTKTSSFRQSNSGVLLNIYFLRITFYVCQHFRKLYHSICTDFC